MKLEIDHFFVFISSNTSENKACTDKGFKEGCRRKHIGQGTSNVCYLFNNAYLELIWVDNSQETKNQPQTKLFERSNWKDNNSCPFGIAFRVIKDSEESFPINVWNYSAPFLPKGISIQVVDNSSSYLREPMFFFVPSRGRPDVSGAYDNHLFNHSIGVKELAHIKIISPYTNSLSPEARYFVDQKFVSFEKGETFSAELHFDSLKQGKEINFNPKMPLVFKY